MDNYRIKEHPILNVTPHENLDFMFNENKLRGIVGDTIASALFANGIRVFGHHFKDQSPQGIFCANGQCAQCLVLMDGLPVKACVELIHPECHIETIEGLPRLSQETQPIITSEPEEVNVPVLIIGGGPAGLSAAIELGKIGIRTLLIDDKHRLGGKLVLQTHRFFGSKDAVYAGTRGIDIATRLSNELRLYPSIEVWLGSTALAVFSDKKVGVLKEGRQYKLIRPDFLIVAAGAREKNLAFKGNTLPGVYGAGAFQTLVNRDLVKPADRLFIIGGGNVGLIAGYHALQAGIKVIGLVEAMPSCGGYKVHKDKLTRLGVPILTSHTILSANGSESVESVTIAEVGENFVPIPGTEQSFVCDTVLIAVGLDPVNEFYLKARAYNLPVVAAGDAEEIAEASAAIFSGKIKGHEVAYTLGYSKSKIPEEWCQNQEILKSKPGRIISSPESNLTSDVFPVIHCDQEIPCDPCASICPNGLITIDPGDIRKIPEFKINNKTCTGCQKCLIICPGLAVTLVDYRRDSGNPVVSIPYELNQGSFISGEMVEAVDTEGASLGKLKVYKILISRASDHTIVVMVRSPNELAHKIAGIRVLDPSITQPMDHFVKHLTDDAIICRCERITAGEIRSLIREGYRDLNEIKTVSRAGMGSCGAKTCNSLIYRLFKEENISTSEIVEQTRRPIFIEVPLGIFAGDTSYLNYKR